MKEIDIRPLDLFNKYLDIVNADINRFFLDKKDFLCIPCPACSYSEYDKGLYKLGFTYVVCRRCGTLYLSPRPSREMIDRFYRESDSVQFWAEHFYKETAEARRERLFKPRAERVAFLTDEFLPHSNLNFIDIGSGYGIFLEEISKISRFNNITGIEPSPELSAICKKKGFQVIEKIMEEVKNTDIQADFATCFEVLEHLYEPGIFIKSVKDILNPGGIFLFSTLTVDGFDIQVLWENSKSVSPPQHINFLSISGIKFLVERTGLEIVDICTPGKLDVDIVRNTVIEKKIVLPRFLSYIINSEDNIKMDFQAFLQRNYLSSHVVVVTRNAIK